MTHQSLVLDRPLEVLAQDVAQWLTTGEDFTLLDCRRPEEFEFNRIGAPQWIPMDELPERLASLGPDRQRHVVVYCHHGGRSLMVARWLRKQGWSQAQSMSGGIDAWACDVDTTVPRY